jgi:hypothetical protein
LRGKETNMNIPVGVPVTITPEAAEHVEKLGMQPELERMLEYLATQIPDVHRLDVVLYPPYDTDVGDKVVIEVIKSLPPGEELDPAVRQWRNWYCDQFGPDVRWNIGALFGYGGGNAR